MLLKKAPVFSSKAKFAIIIEEMKLAMLHISQTSLARMFSFSPVYAPAVKSAKSEKRKKPSRIKDSLSKSCIVFLHPVYQFKILVFIFASQPPQSQNFIIKESLNYKKFRE